MATAAEKLASSLDVLRKLQEKNAIAIQTKDITRTHRERLQANGFIQEVMKGWYIPAHPDEPAGESTAWYASFWAFSAAYLAARFDGKWCLSPEQSISLHLGDWTVPRQLLVRTPKGGNKPTALLHDTSIFDIRLEISDKADDYDTKEGLRLICLPQALISCSPNQFTNKPIEMRTALSMISDPTEILRRLLSGSHTTIAGRLAGAFRNIGRDRFADEIISTMESAGHKVSETDPFEEKPTFTFDYKEVSPHVNRLKMLWDSFREPIIEHFPAPPEKNISTKAYLEQMDAVYVTDAYHSLSIEGYRVSESLIEKVRQGNWNPDASEEDRENLNALAARGYWQAFQAVKTTVESALNGENPGEAVSSDHQTWYRELFGPSVTAGIIEPADLAGYRNRPVYIRRSMHTPPQWDAVRELMPTLFELLATEENPAVRVVLGHFIFVFIHPYIDGNGRIGRFLMNVMMATGGYPWLVIPVERRDEYMDALESASVGKDIIPFTQFLGDLVNNNADEQHRGM